VTIVSLSSICGLDC